MLSYSHDDPFVPFPVTLCALAILVPMLMVFACSDSYTVDGDDDSADDDTAADDDVADDDAADDDDDATDDDATDDDAADDDTAGDDDTAPEACTVSVGVPDPVWVLSGTCHANPEDCDGGSYGMGDPAGTCAAGLTCCIDTDQCVNAMGFTCVANQEDCPGEPPEAGMFPQFGCPPNTPVCCTGEEAPPAP